MPARLIKIKYITIRAEKVASYCFALLHRRRSTEVNQTLHDAWPSPGLVHYMYIFRVLALQRNFARCKIHFASKSCILLYWQHYCMAFKQWASVKVCGVIQETELRNFRRERHLYSARRPSHWASAHIVVLYIFIMATLRNRQ